jgi:diguanylate cyclase (GGDEF)-like protein
MSDDARAPRSRLAQRLFLLFVLVAVLPLALTDWIATLATTQVAEDLSLGARSQATRQVSRQVLDRLLNAKSLLRLAPEAPPGGSADAALTEPAGLGQVFHQVTLLGAQGQTHWPASEPASLASVWASADSGLERPQAAHTAAEVQLRLDFSLPSQPRVLLGAFRDGSLRWIAEVDSGHLWAPLTDAGLDTAWSVRDNRGRLLVRHVGEDSPLQRESDLAEARGDVVSSNTQLFLAGELGAGEWLFTQQAPRPRVRWQGLPLALWLGAVALLGLLAVALFSHWSIRRTLQPLRQLTQGTQALAAGAAGTRVEIRRDDEIGDLADAFNDMAQRIETQIGTLEGLAAIDRDILDGVSFERVAGHALQRLASRYPRACASVNWREGASALHRSWMTRGPADALLIRSEQLELDGEALMRFAGLFRDELLDPAQPAAASRQALPRWLCPGDPARVATIALLPLRHEGQTQALIVLGLAEAADDAALQPAREVRDRLAVAMAARSREQELVYRAAHDSLTGLANRYGLHQRIEQTLDRLADDAALAVLSLDLDHFKDVNDTLGHEAGDELLCAASRRLKSCVPASALVARPGGDEFILLLPGADPAAAATLARLAIAALGRPFTLRGVEQRLGASVGIALHPHHGRTREELLRCADIALFAAKAAGRGQHMLFTPELDRAARERVQLQAELRRALERNEFVVHYQPRVQPRDGRILSAEALIRWQHPERGLLYPGAFIDVAESSGLIDEIGRWVLEAACTQAAAWRREGTPLRRISVNVSTRQLVSGELTGFVRDALSHSGLPAEALELEVTESLLMGDPGEACAQLAEMRRWGVTIALDDFGTGYSSMSILRQLPIDVMKIDRSFVVGLGTDDGAMAVTRAIVALARSLRLHLVAEGIETEAQAEVLRSMGCDELQGYLFSRPVPADLFELLPGLRQGPALVAQD